MESILKTVRKMTGVGEDNPNFDVDLIADINLVFMDLHQIGVGPEEVFSINNESTVWTDFIPEESDLELKKALPTYMYLKVKLLFDPPSSSTHLDCINKQIDRCEWRFNYAIENKRIEEEIQNGEE